MSDSTNVSSRPTVGHQSPIQAPIDEVEAIEEPTASEQELQALVDELALLVERMHATDTWQGGTGWVPGPVQQVPPTVPVPPPGQVPPTGQVPPASGPPRPPQLPPDELPHPPSSPGPKPGPGPVPTPPQFPPGMPGPGMPPMPPEPPTFPPSPPTDPGPPPTKPPTDPVDDGFDLKPWLIGAGVLGAGVAGVVAFRTGAHNVRALRATAASFDSGAMHQGGLHAIRDARLGARFTGGIGTGSYLQVALPFVNRVGTGGRLTSVARGHLDHAELLASAAALRRTVGDGVTVHEPLRRSILEALESGRSMPSILDDLDRSAAGARPVFTNPRLAGYWDDASIIEHGPKVGGAHVTSAVSVDRPELALRAVADDAVDGAGRTPRHIVETGRTTRIDHLVAGRGASLGDRGLADGVGSIQAANVATLPPALRERAIAASKVDPGLVEAIGLRGAYMQRWRDRLALGASEAAEQLPPTAP
jgi:hypothetical protein